MPFCTLQPPASLILILPVGRPIPSCTTTTLFWGKLYFLSYFIKSKDQNCSGKFAASQALTLTSKERFAARAQNWKLLRVKFHICCKGILWNLSPFFLPAPLIFLYPSLPNPQNNVNTRWWFKNGSTLAEKPWKAAKDYPSYFPPENRLQTNWPIWSQLGHHAKGPAIFFWLAELEMPLQTNLQI